MNDIVRSYVCIRSVGQAAAAFPSGAKKFQTPSLKISEDCDASQKNAVLLSLGAWMWVMMPGKEHTPGQVTSLKSSEADEESGWAQGGKPLVLWSEMDRLIDVHHSPPLFVFVFFWPWRGENTRSVQIDGERACAKLYYIH